MRPRATPVLAFVVALSSGLVPLASARGVQLPDPIEQTVSSTDETVEEVTATLGVGTSDPKAQQQGGSGAIDFKQCANADGDCRWINSILQQNNSKYLEGMSVPQRVVLTDITSTDGNKHEVKFSHEGTKGGVHAYDWLTSYDQAIAAAKDAGNAYADLSGQACDDAWGPKASKSVCDSLRSGANKLEVAVPDDPFKSEGGSTQSRIDAYEKKYGDRTIALYGDAGISNGSLAVSHTVADGRDTDNSYVEYTLTWTSASETVLIELAGHLAKTKGGADGWNEGAALVSGAPYHFKLATLDGDALGSQDNQIKSIEQFKASSPRVDPPGGGSGGGRGQVRVAGIQVTPDDDLPHTGPQDANTLAGGLAIATVALALRRRRLLAEQSSR